MSSAVLLTIDPREEQLLRREQIRHSRAVLRTNKFYYFYFGNTGTVYRGRPLDLIPRNLFRQCPAGLPQPDIPEEPEVIEISDDEDTLEETANTPPIPNASAFIRQLTPRIRQPTPRPQQPQPIGLPPIALGYQPLFVPNIMATPDPKFSKFSGEGKLKIEALSCCFWQRVLYIDRRRKGHKARELPRRRCF